MCVIKFLQNNVCICVHEYFLVFIQKRFDVPDKIEVTNK